MTVASQPSLVLVGRYRLDAPLGQRSDGWFCRAHDLVQDEAVMVKMFRSTVDEPAARAFAARAKALVGLRHDHLMTLSDGGIADGHPYLVLETVEGFELLDAKPGRPLSAPDTAVLGAGLADALAHMHEKGVVHGDLTPASVVTDANGQRRLVGFGFGRDQDGEAPADVRALGLVLARCVDPIPGPLARVLSAMTSANPARRPSAAECARSLRRVAHTLESGRWSPTAAVPRGWVAGLAAAGVLVTGAVVAFGPMRMSQEAEPPVAVAVPTMTSQLPPPDTTTTAIPAQPPSYPPSAPSHSSTTRRPPTTSARPTARPNPPIATQPTTTSPDPTTFSADPTTTAPTTTDDAPPGLEKKPFHLPPGLLKKLLWWEWDGWGW
ncbi:protein kinase [Kutzneria buriramensis]|nr:protein kinase [Kutzneria buriramensis]